MVRTLLLSTTILAVLLSMPVFADDAIDKAMAVRSAAVMQFPDDEGKQGEVTISNGPRDAMNVSVVSWRDWPFQTVKHQAYDFSCGSATVATLMTYVYGQNVSERDVFKAMFDAGDQEKIKREGFSMLDMANYLRSQGYKANGFKISLATVQKNRIPFIALINNKGYNHFVVVKGVAGPFVLVGDPNNGNRIYRRDQFEKMWNGIALVVTNEASKARAVFNSPKEWRLVRSLATMRENNIEQGLDTNGLDPIQWQIAPTETDILTTTMNVLGNTRDTSSGGVITPGSGL